MKRGPRLLAAFAAAMMAVAGLAMPAAVAMAATRDWSQTITKMPDGAYRLGNPQAKVKLVEFFSLTCPHCGHFVKEGLPTLTAKYIAPGLVSLEMRHALRDPADFAASLLARCAGPAGYFGALDMIFAQQDAWVAKFESYQNANLDKLKALPREAALAKLAEESGLDALVAPSGITVARANACIADKAEADVLGKMAMDAWETRKIPGTPAFLLNGALLDDTAAWAALQPRIDAALK
jgi:protein-disulfide isomerase